MVLLEPDEQAVPLRRGWYSCWQPSMAQDLLGLGLFLHGGKIELSPDDPRPPGRFHELVRPEPLSGPGEILNVDVDEGSVRAVDVTIDRPIRHAIGAALSGLRPMALEPPIEVFGFDTSHYLRHECLRASCAYLVSLGQRPDVTGRDARQVCER